MVTIIVAFSIAMILTIGSFLAILNHRMHIELDEKKLLLEGLQEDNHRMCVELEEKRLLLEQLIPRSIEWTMQTQKYAS